MAEAKQYAPFDVANVERIPQELRDRPQWVCWKLEPKSDKPGEFAKVPYSIHGHEAKSNDPKTWSTCDAVLAAYQRGKNKYAGIGFMFTGTDPYCGVDFDDCYASDQLDERVVASVKELNSYTELSASGTGLHVICRAKLPSALKRPDIEMYDAARYFALTGRHLAGTPESVNDAQGVVADLYAQYKPVKPATVSLNGVHSRLADDEALRRAQTSDKFRKLFDGDLAEATGDDSVADEKLCCILARVTRDPAQIDRLLRRSKLMREKWNRQDYRDGTIAKALAYVPVAGIAAEQVTPERVSWLWPGYLPLGKLGLLDGDPSVGKSLMTVDFTARVTTGDPFPHETARRDPAGAVLMTGEDDPTDTVVPRLIAAGADLKRVRIITGVNPNGYVMTIPDALDDLALVIDEYKAAFLVVDPVNVFLSDGIDPHKDQSVRRALGPLSAFANRMGCFVLLIRHWSKTGNAKAIYRGGGSIAYIAASRVAFLAAADSKRPGQHIFAMAKSNVGTCVTSIEYQVRTRAVEAVHSQMPYLAWGAQTAKTASDVMLEEMEVGEDTKTAQAVRFLEQALQDGSRLVKDIERAAHEQGISYRTLRRARTLLGLEPRRQGRQSVLDPPCHAKQEPLY